eukprot:6467446-Amphidinium_carterae.2
MIVSDPTEGSEGTILRPTAVFGTTTSAPKKCKMGNNWETRDTEGQRFWELIAMYKGNKAIWLAAGLAYHHGQESTGVTMIKHDRGFVERITPFGNLPYTGAGTAQRRMSRALLVETTPAYLSHQIEAPDANAGDRSIFRRWKFSHIAHQYRRVQQTEITARPSQLPARPSEIRQLQLFHPAWTRGLTFLRDIPPDYEKSTFVQLTYASENDRALEYQHLVVKELARKAFNWDHRHVIPTPTYMQDLVTYDPEAAYVRDLGWPWTSLTMAYTTASHYDFLLTQARQNEEQYHALEDQNVEMHHTSEDEAMASTDEEVLFANEEEDRSLRVSCAAARRWKSMMEHVAVLQPMFPKIRRKLGHLLSQEKQGPRAKNEDYVRKITQETFKVIQKQEEVLSEWKRALVSLDEDSEAHRSLLDQIAVVTRMVDYYKSAMQAAHAYAPVPSPPSGSITLSF